MYVFSISFGSKGVALHFTLDFASSMPHPRRSRAQRRAPRDNRKSSSLRTLLLIDYDAARLVASRTILGLVPFFIFISSHSARSILVLSVLFAYKYAPSGLIEGQANRALPFSSV